jgi:hypothetical protein
MKKSIFCAVLLSFAIGCSPKKRNKSEAPTAPPPMPLASPLATPLVTPMATPWVSPVPTGQPFRGGANNDFGSSWVDEEELKPVENYNPKNVENLNKTDGAVKRFTGSRDSKGDNYTDAASDSLMAYLRKQAQSESVADNRVDNLKFAESIREVKIQSLTYGKVEIKVKVLVESKKSKKAKSDQTQTMGQDKRDSQDNKTNAFTSQTNRNKKIAIELTLTGNINDRFAKLKNGRSGSKDSVISAGEFRCVDLDEESCETSILRLKSKDGAMADVVLRKTIAELHVNYNEKQDNKSDKFRTFVRLFENTRFRTHFDQPIVEKTLFDSFAVVNGRSELAVKVLLEKAEALVFKAPLISSMKPNNEVNVDTKRNLSAGDLTDEELRKSKNIYGISYGDMIEEAKLVKNNGLGQIQIDLKLKSGDSTADIAEIFNLRILRIVKPIIELDEDSIFFELDNE